MPTKPKRKRVSPNRKKRLTPKPEKPKKPKAPKPGRDPNGRFLKGSTGNPFGRPKKFAELSLKCKDLTPQALEQLTRIMLGESPSNEPVRPGDVIRAAELIMAYAYGKPPQKLDVAVADARGMSDEELKAMFLEAVEMKREQRMQAQVH